MTVTNTDTSIAAQLVQQIRDRGYKVFTAPFADPPNGVINGQTDDVKKTVQIRPGLNSNHKEEVVAHELSHIVLLHSLRSYNGNLPGGELQAEVEAATTTYLVLHALGRDDNLYPARYLFEKTDGDADLVETVLPAASAAAADILRRLP